MQREYTDAMIAEIVAKREEGQKFESITKFINKLYGTDKSVDAVRALYNRNKNIALTASAVGNIAVLKEIARTKRANSQRSKENRTILDALNNQDELLEQIEELVAQVKPYKTRPATKPVKGRTSMTMEALISDLHIGKLTNDFNLEVARQRLRKFVDVFYAEYKRYGQLYNIDRVVLAIIGDLFENSVMHGAESLAGCEFQNPEQIRWCIQLLFEEVIQPIAALGVRIDVVGVAGNHGRQEKAKTYQLPTKNSLEWVILKTLQLLCEKTGQINVKWTITEGGYVVMDIYGNKILYEHGDLIKGYSRDACLKHLANRSSQVGYLLAGMRFGHIHTFMSYEDGRIISNASLCGADSYSEALGYTSQPGMVINYYCDSKRENKFYHSFLVQLA